MTSVRAVIILMEQHWCCVCVCVLGKLCCQGLICVAPALLATVVAAGSNRYSASECLYPGKKKSSSSIRPQDKDADLLIIIQHDGFPGIVSNLAKQIWRCSNAGVEWQSTKCLVTGIHSSCVVMDSFVLGHEQHGSGRTCTMFISNLHADLKRPSPSQGTVAISGPGCVFWLLLCVHSSLRQNRLPLNHWSVFVRYKQCFLPHEQQQQQQQQGGTTDNHRL